VFLIRGEGKVRSCTEISGGEELNCKSQPAEVE